jgi:hypothetical protein
VAQYPGITMINSQKETKELETKTKEKRETEREKT